MQDVMTVTEVKLENLSGIGCRYFEAEIPELGRLSTLIVEFSGECGFGSSSNSDACFMDAMIAAGLKAWGHPCLILDLRRLKYEWGDMMSMIFFPPHELISLTDKPVQFPFAVIVSDLNRTGLTSLIKDEMSGNPKEFCLKVWKKRACECLISQSKPTQVPQLREPR